MCPHSSSKDPFLPEPTLATMPRDKEHAAQEQNYGMSNWRVRIGHEGSAAGRIMLQTLQQEHDDRLSTTSSNYSRASAASLYRTSSGSQFPSGSLRRSSSALRSASSLESIRSLLVPGMPMQDHEDSTSSSFGRNFGARRLLSADEHSQVESVHLAESSNASVEKLWPGRGCPMGRPLRPGLRAAVDDQVGDGYRWVGGAWRARPQTSPRMLPI